MQFVRSIIFSTKVFAVSTLIFLSSLTLFAQPTRSIYELPIGTRIKVRMDTEINSRVNSVNDTFIVRVIEPVMNRGVEMISKGAIIDGRITEVSRAAYGGSDGELDVQFVRLRLGRDDAIEFEAKLVKPIKAPSRTLFKAVTIGGLTAVGAWFGATKGGGSGAMVGAAIGGGTGSVVAFGRKGSDVRIKTNEEFEIELTKEAVLPAEETF
jgi:hypothetical protein